MRHLYLALTIFSFLACKSQTISHFIIGSWYSYSGKNELYEEIHINDSLFIYCTSQNADIIIPFSYFIDSDTLFITNDNDELKEKYTILSANEKEKELVLKHNGKIKVFHKLDIEPYDFDYLLKNEKSLEEFSNAVIKRAKNTIK